MLISAQFWEENCKSMRENADVASELPKKIYSVLIWAQFWEENCKSMRENVDVASELPKEQAMITLQEMAVHSGFNRIQHVVK